MNKEVNKIYIDFFEYYDNVKDKIDYIFEKCEFVDILFENIIGNLNYYYNNIDDIKFKHEVFEYFENKDFLNSTIFKIKYTIDYVCTTFYNVCEMDVDLFNQYVELMYYISILEDLIVYYEHNNFDTYTLESDLKQLNDIIYNKEEIINEFNEYLSNKIEKELNEQESFFPSVLIFKLINSVLHDDKEQNEGEYIQGMVNEFLNNMGSFEELSKVIKKNDILLYNKILKLENVILKLQYSRVSNENLFGENNKDIINSYLIELIHLYNVWLCEIDRINDIYGIEYVVKYKDLIYYASIVKDIIEYFGDINENDENLGDYYLALYESILNNDMDDFEQYVLYGEDLVDQLCEHFELVVNKLEEQIEFLYTLFTKNN